MSQTLELSEPVYEAVLQAAEERGITPEEWVADHLPKRNGERPDAVPPEVRDLLWRHVVVAGDPAPVTNEEIDAELARAYGDPHDDESEAPSAS